MFALSSLTSFVIRDTVRSRFRPYFTIHALLLCVYIILVYLTHFQHRGGLNSFSHAVHDRLITHSYDSILSRDELVEWLHKSLLPTVGNKVLVANTRPISFVLLSQWRNNDVQCPVANVPLLPTETAIAVRRACRESQANQFSVVPTTKNQHWKSGQQLKDATGAAQRPPRTHATNWERAYTAVMPLNSNISGTVLQLKQAGWFDEYTNRLSVQFMAYNTRLDGFILVDLSWKVQDSGILTPEYHLEPLLLSATTTTTSLGVGTLALEILVLLGTVVSVGCVYSETNTHVKLLKGSGQYTVWQAVGWCRFLDIISFICLFIAFVVKLTLVAMADRGASDHFYANNRSKAATIQGGDAGILWEFLTEFAEVSFILTVFHGINISLLWIRLLRFLNKCDLFVVWSTTIYQTAVSHLCGILIVGLIILVGWAMMGCILFGSHMTSFSSIHSSMGTLLLYTFGHMHDTHEHDMSTSHSLHHTFVVLFVLMWWIFVVSLVLISLAYNFFTVQNSTIIPSWNITDLLWRFVWLFVPCCEAPEKETLPQTNDIEVQAQNMGYTSCTELSQIVNLLKALSNEVHQKDINNMNGWVESSTISSWCSSTPAEHTLYYCKNAPLDYPGGKQTQLSTAMDRIVSYHVHRLHNQVESINPNFDSKMAYLSGKYDKVFEIMKDTIQTISDISDVVATTRETLSGNHHMITTMHSSDIPRISSTVDDTRSAVTHMYTDITNPLSTLQGKTENTIALLNQVHNDLALLNGQLHHKGSTKAVEGHHDNDEQIKRIEAVTTELNSHKLVLHSAAASAQNMKDQLLEKAQDNQTMLSDHTLRLTQLSNNIVKLEDRVSTIDHNVHNMMTKQEKQHEAILDALHANTLHHSITPLLEHEGASRVAAHHAIKRSMGPPRVEPAVPITTKLPRAPPPSPIPPVHTSTPEPDMESVSLSAHKQLQQQQQERFMIVATPDIDEDVVSVGTGTHRGSTQPDVLVVSTPEPPQPPTVPRDDDPQPGEVTVDDKMLDLVLDVHDQLQALIEHQSTITGKSESVDKVLSSVQRELQDICEFRHHDTTEIHNLQANLTELTANVSTQLQQLDTNVRQLRNQEAGITSTVHFGMQQVKASLDELVASFQPNAALPSTVTALKSVLYQVEVQQRKTLDAVSEQEQHTKQKDDYMKSHSSVHDQLEVLQQEQQKTNALLNKNESVHGTMNELILLLQNLNTKTDGIDTELQTIAQKTSAIDTELKTVKKTVNKQHSVDTIPVVNPLSLHCTEGNHSKSTTNLSPQRTPSRGRSLFRTTSQPAQKKRQLISTTQSLSSSAIHNSSIESTDSITRLPTATTRDVNSTQPQQLQLSTSSIDSKSPTSSTHKKSGASRIVSKLRGSSKDKHNNKSITTPLPPPTSNLTSPKSVSAPSPAHPSYVHPLNKQQPEPTKSFPPVKYTSEEASGGNYVTYEQNQYGIPKKVAVTSPKPAFRPSSYNVQPI